MDMASRRGVRSPDGPVAGTKPSGTRVTGPAFFGKGVSAQGSEIKRSAVGAGCTLGPGTMIEDCLLLDGVTVGEKAALRGCVIGQECHIGAGAELTNCVLGDRAQVPPFSKAEGANIDPRSSL